MWDITVEYFLDKNSWMTNFEDAFVCMLERGEYDASTGCIFPPCTLAMTHKY